MQTRLSSIVHGLIHPFYASSLRSSVQSHKAKPITLSRPFITSSIAHRKSIKMSGLGPLEPPVNRGMSLDDLDRDAFKLNIDVLAARVIASQIGKLKQQLSSSILTIPRIASVAPDPTAVDHKLLLLEKAQKEELPTEIQDLIAQSQLEVLPHTVSLPYEYWNANQILRAILPAELLDDLPTSFTIVGHIAHFNLRDEYLPYKNLIGQIILDKNPTIETVVNKLDSIDNEFRFFQMEVLAGKPDYKVTTSENGCIFRFDFSKVYWNSRLQTEHTRLVDSFSDQDIIADGFAGVGPFAIPAAKKGCLGVLANDLNPMSAEGLRENVQLNKVEDNVRCYNMDGRDFFRQVVQQLYQSPFSAKTGPRLSANKAAKRARHEREQRKHASTGNESNSLTSAATEQAPTTQGMRQGRFVDHFILNLPATAIEFLDAFKGIYMPLLGATPEENASFWTELAAHSRARSEGAVPSEWRLPMVHCYCFTKELESYEKDICERAGAALGVPFRLDDFQDASLSLVRSVAPKKDMYRLSFRLPASIVFDVPAPSFPEFAIGAK